MLQKRLTTTAVVATENHKNYNVLEEIFVIFAQQELTCLKFTQ